MKTYFSFSFLLIILVLGSFKSDQKGSGLSENSVYFKSSYQPMTIRLNAVSAEINTQAAEIIEDSRLSAGKGVTLKRGESDVSDPQKIKPDLVFRVKVPKAGRYVMTTYALTNAEGAEIMKKATSKFESLYIKIQIDEHRPTKRVVYVPWDVPRQESGKFEFTGSEQQLKIWLPQGVHLEYVQLSTYIPPVVPEIVKNYQPEIVPPSNHPRLWVNQQSLQKIKNNLEVGENTSEWEKVKNAALTPFSFRFNPDEEISYNAKLESAAVMKAFYYLMTGNKQYGQEATRLMVDYLSHVEFGNLLDITREIGRAIYTGSLVYDWCYDILKSEEKNVIGNNLMRLADDMEIGWPPFRQSIINGHGNEAQVNRDLLSMSIAIYDENPVPYQYCSYRILEELVPMRKWEYQSPRHNQGINYGAYRISWDLHAAWLFYRMTGKPVFDDNITTVPKYWLYMRLPDGQMLRDGDGFDAGNPGEFFYWKRPQTMFLFYTYGNDPVIKGEFRRQGGIPDDPIMFLLLNDPMLKEESSLKSLPLTIDFGPILGSMVARTGWNTGLNSNDVVAEIKGGGFHFGNHQHSDAGSMQIYYRGFQVADIGLYGFYGPPYDFNFHKRSIAHSMMLARDPAEKFGNTESNDGGTKLNQRNPRTPQEALSDPWYHNGKVISSDFGPLELHPLFSYFDVDLVGAYSNKIKNYNRKFCFLNLEKDSIPAAIILADDMTTANAEFRKYWQINTHNKPELTSKGFILNNRRNGMIGKTHVEMLVPQAAERETKLLSEDEAISSFEFKYEIPGRLAGRNFPEARGHRIMVSPGKAANRDRFLTVFQMTAGNTKPLNVTHSENQVSDIIILEDRVISISKGNNLINENFALNIPGKGKYKILLTGLKPGDWNIKSRNNKTHYNAKVIEGKNTIYFTGDNGEYIISSGRIAGAKDLMIKEK